MYDTNGNVSSLGSYSCGFDIKVTSVAIAVFAVSISYSSSSSSYNHQQFQV